MKNPIPKQIRKVKSFIAMEILEELQRLQAQGSDVISFSIGEPDLEAPPSAREACIRALREGFTKYTHSQGIPELREAIASHYQKKYGVTIHPDQILVTEGTSPALLLIFSVLLHRGEEVILTNPHYPCYPSFIYFAGGSPCFVKVREEDGFQYRPEEIRKKIGKRTRAIFINSPSNPTGNLIPETTLREIARMKPWVVSDEIYHGLVYEGHERSILEFTDRAFVVNGFSKSYAMTGYRLGYLIAPKKFIPTLKILHQNLLISANPFVQKAGLAALTEGGEDQKKMREIFATRRKVMLAGVRRLGFQVTVEPTGAFYIFANVKKFTKNSYRFALDLLKKTRVGITPGIDFGSAGEGYLRFSYATSVEKIEEGIRRLERYLNFSEITITHCNH